MKGFMCKCVYIVAPDSRQNNVHLKAQCHEMVCQTETTGGLSLDLNNPIRTGTYLFTLVKSCIKKIWRREQEDSRFKMVGARFHCYAKLRAPTPLYATTGPTSRDDPGFATNFCDIKGGGGEPPPRVEPGVWRPESWAQDYWQTALKGIKSRDGLSAVIIGG
jgi:hypothetical protein